MKKHVVVIEDEPDFLILLTQALEEENYRVTGFKNLVPIDELIELSADCFVVDEHLPGVSGHIICIMLKFYTQTRTIPVILTSAIKDFQKTTAHCDADAYVQKPFGNIHELAQTVTAVIERGC